MFQLSDRFMLHESVRRRICVGAFFLLCVAPTAGVLAWGVSRWLPWHTTAEASRLSRELGLCVSLSGVRHPRPGVVVYEGLQLADPETGQTLLGCRRLEAAWGRPEDPRDRATASLALVATEPEIEAAGLEPLAELVRRGLGRRASWSKLEVRLSAGEATLRSAAGPWKLTGVEGFLRPVAGGSCGEIGFRLAGVQTTEPVRICIGRDHRETPPRTGLELYTGGGTLPCAFLGLGLPGLERLGPSSGFRGYLWVNQKPEGWAYELTGQLAGVDLESLVSGCSPHKLTGRAQVTIGVARLLDGRLQEAAGSVSAGPGLVSRSLLDASVESLGLERGAEPRSPGTLVPYEQLAASFQIDSGGLRVRGSCPVPGRGTVMVDHFSRLLAEPAARGQPIPVGALVRTLVPGGGVPVPATRASDWLMRVLPLPEAAPDAGPDTSLRSAPVSLRDPFERR